MSFRAAHLILLAGLLGLTACLPDLDKPDTGTIPDGDADTDVDADTDADADADADTDPETIDDDGDGFSEADGDCNDDDASINPDATEVWYDGVDQDCSGGSDYDQDGDGYDSDAYSGEDCDDLDSAIGPEADEVCDEVDNDCDGDVDEDDATDASTWYADSDGDSFGDPETSSSACTQPTGYVADGSDCLDSDAAINPDALEICDGADNDCDGLIDDDDDSITDQSTWYADTDADGYGDVDVTDTACSQPSGYVADSSDCDDAVASTFPGADEYCDEVDNDCDGTADEDDAVDAPMWYADSDGDSYGDPLTTSIACDQPSGFVADDMDCDDGDAGISPAEDEYCDDVDNDCDGTVDEAEAVDSSTWYEDGDGDGFGDPLSTLTACDQPSGYTASASEIDCDDTDPATFPGASEVCEDAVVNDCNSTEEDAFQECWSVTDLSHSSATIEHESTGESAGHSLDWAGDLDGDGNDDFLVGDYWADYGSISDVGAAYIVYGPVTADSDLSYAGTRIYGDSYNDRVGYCVAGVGDANGDALPDVLIGANGLDDGLSGAGGALLYLNPSSGTLSVADADTILLGESEGDGVGQACAKLGDIDGDGNADFIVGAPAEDSNGTSSGAIYIVDGPAFGTVSLAYADAKIIGEAEGDMAGDTLSPAGDTDGDGVQDMLIGVRGDDGGGEGAGAAYVVLGSSASDMSLASADAKLTGEAAGDAAGYGVGSAGDINSDGYDDLLVGAPQAADSSGAVVGAAYLLLGPVTADLALSSADAILRGEDSSDWAGWSVTGAGDVDADGIDDILVGAPYRDTGAYWGGSVYLLLGPVSGEHSLSTADIEMSGATSSEMAGYTLAGTGDSNGDGYDDILIGSPWYDGDGAVRFVLGTSF